jgi:hypothetical protein
MFSILSLGELDEGYRSAQVAHLEIKEKQVNNGAGQPINLSLTAR